jgi:hypothetical protein
MDFDVIAARLEFEAQSLKETIAVASHRLSEIETFLSLGKKFADNSPRLDGTLGDLLGTYSATTRRDRVLDASERILRDGKRRGVQELLGELESMGVSPGGSEPAQTLSTYLSRDKERFSSDVRQGGWTLRTYEVVASTLKREVSTSGGLQEFTRLKALITKDRPD